MLNTSDNLLEFIQRFSHNTETGFEFVEIGVEHRLRLSISIGFRPNIILIKLKNQITAGR